MSIRINNRNTLRLVALASGFTVSVVMVEEIREEREERLNGDLSLT